MSVIIFILLPIIIIIINRYPHCAGLPPRARLRNMHRVIVQRLRYIIGTPRIGAVGREPRLRQMVRTTVYQIIIISFTPSANACLLQQAPRTINSPVNISITYRYIIGTPQCTLQMAHEFRCRIDVVSEFPRRNRHLTSHNMIIISYNPLNAFAQQHNNYFCITYPYYVNDLSSRYQISAGLRNNKN